MTAAIKLKHAYECMQAEKAFNGQPDFQQEYHIKPGLSYQKFSHFTQTLSKCFSFDAVAHCLQYELKNVFDFILLRFCFYRNDSTISFTLSGNACNYSMGSASALWQQEAFFSEQHFASKDLQAAIVDPERKTQSVNGWNFTFRENSGIIVTIVTNEAATYLPVLEPLVENIYSKLLSLKIVAELTEENAEHLQITENQKTVLRVVKNEDTRGGQ